MYCIKQPYLCSRKQNNYRNAYNERLNYCQYYLEVRQL